MFGCNGSERLGDPADPQRSKVKSDLPEFGRLREVYGSRAGVIWNDVKLRAQLRIRTGALYK